MSGRKSPNYLRPANAQTPLPKVVYIYKSTGFCYFFPTLSNPSNHHKAARCSNIFLTVSSLHPFCPGTSFQKLLRFNPRNVWPFRHKRNMSMANERIWYQSCHYSTYNFNISYNFMKQIDDHAQPSRMNMMNMEELPQNSHCHPIRKSISIAKVLIILVMIQAEEKTPGICSTNFQSFKKHPDLGEIDFLQQAGWYLRGGAKAIWGSG